LIAAKTSGFTRALSPIDGWAGGLAGGLEGGLAGGLAGGFGGGLTGGLDGLYGGMSGSLEGFRGDGVGGTSDPERTAAAIAISAHS
tara:strand:- start:1646 stop:1903 length:258 start_codon:yes stop_codon:yes gene_type:complete